MNRTLDDTAGNYLRIDSTRPLTASLVLALSELCDRAEDTDRLGTLVLHVTGGSVPSPEPGWPGSVDIRLVTRWERTLRRFERANAATIAVAEGDCQGPALNVLLAADYRIGTPDLRLRMAGSRELWPGMAVHRLANQLGVARARTMVLFGVEVAADRALEIGLVDEVSTDVARSLTRMSALAGELTGAELAIRRRLLLDAATTGFDESLSAHLAACDRTLRRTGDRVGAST